MTEPGLGSWIVIPALRRLKQKDAGSRPAWATDSICKHKPVVIVSYKDSENSTMVQNFLQSSRTFYNGPELQNDGHGAPVECKEICPGGQEAEQLSLLSLLTRGCVVTS